MPPTIVSPADCEVRAVIRFLSAKGVKTIDIHREICEVCVRIFLTVEKTGKVLSFKKRKKNVSKDDLTNQLFLFKNT